jgi:hypothetical protein
MILVSFASPLEHVEGLRPAYHQRKTCSFDRDTIPIDPTWRSGIFDHILCSARGPFLVAAAMVMSVLWLLAAGHMLTSSQILHRNRNSMMSWCIDWDPRHTWNDSLIPSKHIHGVWEHSYAVDGQMQMDPPSCHFHHTENLTASGTTFLLF